MDQKWIARPANDQNPPTRRVLRLGDSGNDVRELQQRLGLIAGVPDGRFGTVTEVAVESFQRAHRLKVDGVCGPLTWAALDG